MEYVHCTKSSLFLISTSWLHATSIGFDHIEFLQEINAAPNNFDSPTEVPDEVHANGIDSLSENGNLGNGTMINDEGDERTVILNNESEELMKLLWIRIVVLKLL